MPLAPRRRSRLLLVALTALAASILLPAAAAPVPVVASPNVELVGAVPDVTAISTAFAKTKPRMFVNTAGSISSYDISNPAMPLPLGRLDLPHFENEAMSLGERADGTMFVLVGLDPAGASATAATLAGSNAVLVVDVSDPRSMRVAANLRTNTRTHTVTCLTTTCEVAYTSGGSGSFDIVDLTDITRPTATRSGAVNPASKPGRSSSGHQWDLDGGGLAWATGGGGAAAFDVSDPRHPVVVGSTNSEATKSPYNDFILHNSHRPGAAAARLFPATGSKDTANPAAGNVLLVTEEDYDSPLCNTGAGEGSFSTWYIPYLDAGRYALDNPPLVSGAGRIEPLDRWNTEIFDSGIRTELGALCSAHYFTYRSDGFVAQAWYQQGTRFLDVRDPHDIKQVGYFFAGASEVWHSYWVPEYGADGRQTGRTTDLVYTNDVVRGIDILRVRLPDTEPSLTQALRAPILPAWRSGRAPDTGLTRFSSDPAAIGFGCRVLVPSAP